MTMGPVCQLVPSRFSLCDFQCLFCGFRSLFCGFCHEFSPTFAKFLQPSPSFPSRAIIFDTTRRKTRFFRFPIRPRLASLGANSQAPKQLPPRRQYQKKHGETNATHPTVPPSTFSLPIDLNVVKTEHLAIVGVGGLLRRGRCRR
jgi:hypothetical protein